jgi:hypothetical protein
MATTTPAPAEHEHGHPGIVLATLTLDLWVLIAFRCVQAIGAAMLTLRTRGWRS